MIGRDPKSAERIPHDVIIVGGGVYGAALALQASALGKSSLLLERADFGQETSAAGLRIVHGGLRYLQDLDLGRFHESVEQRRWWLRTFPELVRPLPCLMPLYGRGLHRPFVLRVALATNDLLSASRNRGLREDRRIPNGSVLDPARTRELFPGVRSADLKGAALWTDAATDSPHRLILEMLRWSAAAGGIALNYVSARELLLTGRRVRGVRAVDERTGEELEFSAPLVVNAAGPWVGELASQLDRPRDELFRPSLAFNVLLRKPLPTNVALALSEPGARGPVYFARPVGDLTYAGTVHVPQNGDPKSGSPARGVPPPDDSEVSEFVARLGRAAPNLALSPRDLIRVFWGLLPAVRMGSSVVEKRPRIIDHGREGGPPGLFSVSGVKFTTAPAVGLGTLRAAGLATRTPDWDRMEAVRPQTRERLSPPRDARDLGPLLQGNLTALRDIMREEAVFSAEDLVRRRLDWNLCDIDLEDAARQVQGLLPELRGSDCA